MPAETHTHRDRVDESAVLDLIWALVATPADPDEPDAALPLDACGLDDELAVLRLWDELCEELAERTVAEPDLADLQATATLGELAAAVLREMRAAT